MSKELATTESESVPSRPFSMAPQSFAECERMAEMVSRSDFCPASFKGKPGDVMIAAQYGAEVGLPFLAALQSIAVINGRPSLYGDGLLGVVQSAPDYVKMEERSPTESVAAGGGKCVIHRRCSDGTIQVTTREFTMAEAKAANLIGKAGPWTQYLGRMLQMRARGLASRDSFADRLKGFQSTEELLDYPANAPVPTKADMMPKPKVVDAEATVTDAAPRQSSTERKPTSGEFYGVASVETRTSPKGKTYYAVTFDAPDGSKFEATTFSSTIGGVATGLIDGVADVDIEEKKSGDAVYRNIVALAAHV